LKKFYIVVNKRVHEAMTELQMMVDEEKQQKRLREAQEAERATKPKSKGLCSEEKAT